MHKRIGPGYTLALEQGRPEQNLWVRKTGKSRQPGVDCSDTGGEVFSYFKIEKARAL